MEKHPETGFWNFKKIYCGDCGIECGTSSLCDCHLKCGFCKKYKHHFKENNFDGFLCIDCEKETMQEYGLNFKERVIYGNVFSAHIFQQNDKRWIKLSEMTLNYDSDIEDLNKVLSKCYSFLTKDIEIEDI